MVVSELRGEKIDIIPYNDEPARFVAKALSPARVREVLVDDDAKQATVVVPDDQLSLAIGREGQNARLAARLTGWRDRHPLRDRVRRGGGRAGLRGGGALRPLRRDPRQRPPLPERRAARLALLRPGLAPGAGQHRLRSGRGSRAHRRAAAARRGGRAGGRGDRRGRGRRPGRAGGRARRRGGRRAGRVRAAAGRGCTGRGRGGTAVLVTGPANPGPLRRPTARPRSP